MSFYSSISEKFAQICENKASEVAVSCPTKTYTFGELHARATEISYHITSLKLSYKLPIAVHCMPSCDAIATIYGVVLSGHFYTSFPTNISAIQLAQLCKRFKVSHMFVDDGSAAISNRSVVSKTNINSFNTVSQLSIKQQDYANKYCYVLLTSGTSGMPKGVVMSQDAILEDASRQNKSLKLRDCDKFALTYPLSASVSGCAIFGGILNGIPVYCAPKFTNSNDIATWINTRRITVMDIDFTNIRRLSQNKQKLETLRFITPAGEPLTQQYLNATRNIVTENCLVQNALASSETRLVFENQISSSDKFVSALIPVGKLSKNKSIKVVPFLNGVPNIGELFVEDHNIFEGYWGSLDSRSHLENILEFDKVFFRTGDILEMNAGSMWVCKGRRDNLLYSSSKILSTIEIEAEIQLRLNKFDIIVVNEPPNKISIIHANAVSKHSVRNATREFLESVDFDVEIKKIKSLETLPTLPNGKLNRRQFNHLDD